MDLFCCPICRQPLVKDNKRLACGSSHSFDVSRRGYVNLLPAHHRKSRLPGDSAEMVSARRAFLEAGYYDPLAARLSDVLRASDSKTHADIGCGEGFFTNAMTDVDRVVYGVDISKAAINAASRYKQLNLAVGNVTSLPLQEGKFDSISVIMAPFPSDTAINVLRRSGRLIRVSPGERHLSEFKGFLYEENRPHQRASLVHEGLAHRIQEEVEFQMVLDAAAMDNLVDMTPMKHKSRKSVPESISQSGLEVTAHFWVDVFERRESKEKLR